MDIFVPDHSKGLLRHAEILKQALKDVDSRILIYPFKACSAEINQNDNLLKFEPNGDTAIFIERLFEHEKLAHYSRRIFISNPEWLTEKDVLRARKLVTEFWHTTRFGLKLLGEVFPDKIHAYTSFTSLPLSSGEPNYNSFAHFSGKSKTRHTQEIINIWIDNIFFPPIWIQSYENDISIPKWMSSGNLRVLQFFLSDREYASEFCRHGVQLCTSQMEGFGHYINEARAMGALILTLDAPPMNELIDQACGVLIPVEQSFPFNCGMRFMASTDEIKKAVTQVLEMPIEARRLLGEKAKKRFEEEYRGFVYLVNNCYRQHYGTLLGKG